ncbi:XrtA-associated tyrosine autokinase [uncultured Desulfuromusa sp.]|uniref:XrtA-associated tyrosine autokinase n=1 Tax=uncultured Desulfuromusa sp. TaxID=219183 RepID=UPI002AA66DF9|nr:XrtA-associated tyrosine autokinase [uncultured Desulfuromusa sp.]
MSRIEDAIKKASSSRNSPTEERIDLSIESRSVKRPNRKNSVVGRINTLLDVVPIKITNLMIATARDEETAVVEEYNKLRSTIISLTEGDTFLNTIMVTSTVSEEGKSMTALNLAISLAKEHDHTVLLVDTDLRRPSVHKYLDLKPDFGLVHCLRDNLPIEKALIKTGVGKLVVLPAGDAVKDPVDMLSSNRMKEIVRELKLRYPERYVIFDTPPALPFADAGVLAGIVDATLFVVREGKAKVEDIVKTLDDFKEQRLLGVVYNDAHTFLKSHGYDYYY